MADVHENIAESRVPTRLQAVVLKGLAKEHMYDVLPNSCVSLLGPRIGKVIDALCRDVGKHPCMGAPVLTAVASGLCGPGMMVRVHSLVDWLQRTLVWSATVAESGSGKTPVLQGILEAVNTAVFAINMVLHKADMMPISPVGHSKTVEHLKSLLKESPDGVVIFMPDELTGQLANLGAQKTGSGVDADYYTALELRSGGRLTDSTVGRGEVVLEMTHVVYTGGMQPAKFAQYISSKGAREIGFEGRFFMLAAPAGACTPEAIRRGKAEAAAAAAAAAAATADQADFGSPSAAQLAAADSVNYCTVPACKLEGIHDVFSVMNKLRITKAAQCCSTASSSSAAALAEAGAATTLGEAITSLLGTYGSNLQQAKRRCSSEDRESHNKKARRSLSDPCALLALVLIELFWMTREPSSHGAMVPVEHVMLLDTIVDPEEQCSCYEVFNNWCELIKQVMDDLDRRRLGDRKGVISKLQGNVLEIAGVLQLLDSAYDRMLQGGSTEPEDGDAAAAAAAAAAATRPLLPKVIQLDMLVCAMDLVRLSTLQRFMLLGDVATAEALMPLYRHISVFGEASFSAGAGGQHGPDPGAAARALPPGWRLLGKAVLTVQSGVQGGLKYFHQHNEVAALFGQDDMVAEGAMKDPNLLSKSTFYPACYAFTYPVQAITNCKVLSNSDANRSPAKEIVSALTHGVAAGYVLRVLAGEALLVKQELRQKYPDKLGVLCLEELELEMPALGTFSCAIDAVTKERKLNDKGAVVLKTVPPVSADVVAEHEQLLKLAKRLHIYGMDLCGFFAPLHARFEAAKAALAAAQDAARQKAHDELADSLLYRAAQSGYITMSRGRGLLSTAGALPMSPMVGRSGSGSGKGPSRAVD